MVHQDTTGTGSSAGGEFSAALHGAAIVDRSEVGRILVTGNDRIDLLHRLSTNDLISVQPGQTIGTSFTTEKGRMVDYATACVREGSLLLLVSPTMEQQFIEWVEKFHIMEDIGLSSVTDNTTMVSVIGPNALQAGSSVFGPDLAPNTMISRRMRFGDVSIACIQINHTVMVHCITDRSYHTDLWNHIVTEAEKHDLGVIGKEAYEAFRIVQGIPVAGHEISEQFNPYDCGLLHSISFTKGCYIGQEVIARLDTYKKVQRELVGVILSQRVEGVKSKVLLYNGEEEVGWLTSISPLSLRGKYPGLAIVKTDHVREGNTLTLKWETGKVQVSIATLPITL